MRIERISFQAFGPYVNKVELAMDELSQHRLFLIKGATGAGKTVILDAITFALYGKSSSGERGDFEAMRSRMANENQKTYVELVFIIREHRYRFYREIVVGKKRSGEVRFKVNVNGGELIDDQFYPFFENCKMTMLEKQAEKLIGLNHAQFIRTMILPQGKFERLLISNSEEKQEILKSLFQSEQWAKLCEALSENLKKAKERVDRIGLEIENCLAQAKVKTLSECQDLSQGLKQQLIPLRKELEQAKKSLEIKQKNYEEQQQLAVLSDKKAAYEEKKAMLLKQDEVMRLKAQQVETAGEYERIFPYIKAYQDNRLSKEQTALQLQEAEKSFHTLKQRYQELQEHSEAVNEKGRQCEELKQQCQVWEQQLLLCAERTAKEKEIQALKQQKHEAKVRLEQYQKALEQIKQQRDNALKQMTALEAMSEQHSKLLIEAERLEAKRLAEKEIVELHTHQREWEANTQKQRQKQEILKQQEQEISKQHELLYQAYLHDSAGLLASLLREGMACPICGSTHHPKPAEARKQLTELTKLKECKAQWDNLIKQIQEIDNWLKQAKIHMEQADKMLADKKKSLQEKYGALDTVDEVQLEKQLTVSTQALTELNEQKRIVQQAEERIPKKEQVYEAALHQYQALKQQYLLLETQCKERYHSICDTNAQTLQKQLQTAIQDIEAYEAFIIQWEQDYKNIQLTLSAKQASVTHLKEASLKAENEFLQAQRILQDKNRFRLDIEKPLMDSTQLEKQRAEIQEYHHQLMELQIAIHELVDQIKGRALEPLAKLKTELDEAQCAERQLADEITRKTYHLEQVQQLERRIVVLQREYEQAVLTNARQSDFVKAMRGDTSIGIERYVLGIMLSHITRSANALLKNVHDGRYQLYRSDDTSGKVRKYGLELSIYDHASASMRSAASLSGGEKFLVSLALSLALSTVVQARNSGVSMESMFIDEGFGSLDEASIADALKVLSSMADSKTMIGIISHVELLKENIPYGIEVTKGKQKSTCRMLL